MTRPGDHQPPATRAGETAEFPPERSVGYALRDTYRAFSRVLASRISAHGVTIGQWYFLRALWEEDGLTQRELSRRVGMMEPTTVTALNGMERRGYVKRVRNAADRRKINIFLTRKGRSLRNALLPYAVEVNEIAAQGVPQKEIQGLRKVLEAMKANLERTDAEPARSRSGED